MNEELKIIITAEIDKLKKNLNEAVDAVKDTAKKSKASLEDINDAFGKVGNASKSFLKGVGGAVAGVTAALLATTAATKEYREGQAKLASSFKAAGSSAAVATKTYNDLYRVLGDSDVATEASSLLAQLTTNEKDLAQWTEICKGAYATFPDSLPIESLIEASNETAKTGQLTGALADALNWAGASEEAFQEKLNACSTEAEREALIRSTLNGLYSEAAVNYETNAASILAQNEAQAKLTAATAEVGEAMQPFLTMLTELGAEILTMIAPKIRELADKHLPAVKEALGGVAEAIGNVIKWILDHWEFVSIMATIIIGIAAAIALVSTALNIATTAATLFNAANLPITLTVMAIVAAIAAVVAIITVCVKYWDEMKAAVANAVNAIWGGIKTAVSAIGNAFASLGNGIKNVFNSVVGFLGNCVTKIKNFFSNIAVTVGKAISNTVNAAINGVLWTGVKIINGFIHAINGAISLINLIPGVEIGKLGLLSVPKLAKGGIVDSATLAVIGERGKEAVMPLENNTEWIDILAGRLSSLMGGGAPIILQVDGRTFAQISVDSINQLTKQRGSLPLVLA